MKLLKKEDTPSNMVKAGIYIKEHKDKNVASGIPAAYICNRILEVQR
jgi:hypothetical protein